MKKILITGAAGTIGLSVLRFLIEKNCYELTALDLKNKRSYRKLKKYRKMINIVNGDVNDPVLIDALIKDHDYVIHLAGVMPPFADLKEDLPRIIDYEGTKNIIRAINDYNPSCFLIYASSTTVYGKRGSDNHILVTDDLKIEKDDYYTYYKAETEKEIMASLKNYTIFRLPALMCNLKHDAPVYNVPLKSYVELISDYDAATAFAKAVEYKKALNKKVFNLSGGEKCRVLFRNYLLKLLKVHGLSVRYLATLFLVDKNFYGGYYEDSKDLQDIVDYQLDTLDQYYERIQKESNKILRFFPKLFAKPFMFSLKRKKK